MLGTRKRSGRDAMGLEGEEEVVSMSMLETKEMVMNLVEVEIKNILEEMVI